MPVVSVRLPARQRSYEIKIGAGLMSELGREARAVLGPQSPRAALISNPMVFKHYGKLALQSLKAANFKTTHWLMPEGERHKSLGSLAQALKFLTESGIERGDVVVALGGGVVGDLTGFAAATYLRGIAFVQVPTTVLAMVDASVGGKTGVNLREGKNLVGAFHQPRLVAIDVETLRSLPLRERAAGLAEVVKKAVIWDAALFEVLERDAEALLALDESALVPVIARAVEIKAEVVRRDERESDLRMLLNFGHTLAHAIEAL